MLFRSFKIRSYEKGIWFRDGEFVPGYGTTVGTGRFLRAGVDERGPAPARGRVPEHVDVG